METVRALFRRIQGDLDQKPDLVSIRRRILIPESSQLSFKTTVLAAGPLTDRAQERAGGFPEILHWIEWQDLRREGIDEDVGTNELGADLAALLSFASGRRVEFANEFPITNRGLGWAHTFHLAISHGYDGGLYGPVRSEELSRRIETVFEALDKLEEKKAIALGGAIRMRGASCCLLQSDVSSAYGLLIAAIETLSREFGAPPHSWEHWQDSRSWDKLLVKLGLEDHAAGQIRAKLLANQHLRLKQTFVEYVLNTLPVSFRDEHYFQYEPAYDVNPRRVLRQAGKWNDAGPLAAILPDSEDQFRTRIGKSYDARSKVFHESLRLKTFSMVLSPGREDEPLAYGLLRLILDRLLWTEIAKRES